jgi:nicotinate phosphoribosyltransferase
MAGDTIALAGEAVDGVPLLVPVLRAGKPVAPPATLDDARAVAARNLAALPETLRRLEAGTVYPVAVSEGLQALARAMG